MEARQAVAFLCIRLAHESRIVAYNLKCPKSAAAMQGRPAPMSKNFLMSELGLGEQVYDRVWQMIPPKLSGTKSYWSREYLDLATFCERQGLPDYFITLTANDGWVELKAMLGGQAPHFRSVEIQGGVFFEKPGQEGGGCA